MAPARTKLYFDGGCRPNPGPMETAVVVRGTSHVRTDLGIGGSSEAEWLALVHAAETAIALGLVDVSFIGDSLLVIRQASRAWKCRAPELRLHAQRFAALTLRLGRFGLRHVPRSRNLAGIALARRHAGLGVV
ncbi:reverse transcriptase-like protein [Flavisphingomonas formosensis]|uniref:reverse transcriptase-like protein n=1 Tax=Flavisphingomonas formosensis TaxID=861534 RepID=UPI001E5DB4D8|nr:reverse transcriptase-like protein [Sphingomonas formosensis]